jgi:hypothetical protein
VNWYSAFDEPQRDSLGRYWIGRETLGSVRGGHCVCLKPQSLRDTNRWYRAYDQGVEGACVGFGSSRMMSLLNRKRYNARWLYHQAQAIDEFPPGTEGTSVRAAMDVLRTQGHVVATQPESPDPLQGILTNRWARTADEVLQALGTPSLDYVTILNSWGTRYPRKVRMPAATLQRLLNEGGEAGLVTDR